MNKKICLVYPNLMKLPKFFNKVTNIPQSSTLLPPLGLLYIASNSKYKIDIIDNRIEKLAEFKLYSRLKIYDIVGFGGTIFEVQEARNISMRLMKEGKITIYGGPNATVNWELYVGDFSIIIRGEGENIFDKIIENYKFIRNIEHLGFKEIRGSLVNLAIFRIKNLDSLKFPNRTLIKLESYNRIEENYLPNTYPVDTISSSRGCPFDCYFCSSQHIWQRRYTYRTPDNIVREIKELMDVFGTRGIYFREDNFTFSKKRTKEFCKKIKPLSVKWVCESRIDAIDKSLAMEMAESGCRGIWFGIESTSNQSLRKIKKGITIEQAKKTILLCKKYGIITGGGFMIGFPWEDIDDMKRTFVESKKLGLDNIFYNRIYAFPHSEMYEDIRKKHLNSCEYNNIIIPDTEYISSKDVTEFYYKCQYNWKKRLIKMFIPEMHRTHFKKRHPILTMLIKKNSTNIKHKNQGTSA
ncbi:MAG: B12-binding domain-containing radical SAM protein [Candidatus Omnitrophica bacterium]|nr:B12-binding domain-containing radical SAM protein [Candidatus Omnitrophota bacterium]